MPVRRIQLPVPAIGKSVHPNHYGCSGRRIGNIPVPDGKPQARVQHDQRVGELGEGEHNRNRHAQAGQGGESEMKSILSSMLKFVKRLTIAFVILVLSIIAMLVAVPSCIAVHYYRKCNSQEMQMRNVNRLMNDNQQLQASLSNVESACLERCKLKMDLKIAEAKAEMEKRYTELCQRNAASESSLKEKVNMMKNELNIVNARHDGELKRIALAHANELERVKAMHNTAIADMNRMQAMKEIEVELAALKAKSTKKPVSTMPEVHITRYNNTNKSNWL